MSSELKKVFVYGTLKRGQPNFRVLKDSANGHSKFICSGITTTKYPLVIGTRYNIPFMLHKPGMGNYVVGEIFEVDNVMFKRLDMLEDYPVFYDREIQDINIGVGDGVVPCWVYLLKDFPDTLLSLPHLSEYKNSDEKPYQER